MGGMEVKVGLIARCDNGGLGCQTWDFFNNMNPAKVAAVTPIGQYPQYPDRYPGAIMVNQGRWTDALMDAFLDGLDAFWTIETPYSWSLFKRARERGVRSVLQINYEWLEDKEHRPDAAVAPADWYLREAAELLAPTPLTHIPNPVDRSIFPWRQRQTACVFGHIAGHQGGYDRNGTATLLRAIPMVRDPLVSFIIYSQLPLKGVPEDSRLTIVSDDLPCRTDLFKTMDVMVYPRRYAGLSLQVDEALSCGIPVLMTDMEPQSRFLPPLWRIPAQSMGKQLIKQEVDIAKVRPEDVAAAIDRFGTKDIAGDSVRAAGIAQSRAWGVIKPRYEAVLAGAP